MGDILRKERSHQIVLNALVNEFVSWKGLRVKVMKSGPSNLFPGGVEFHNHKSYMKEIIRGYDNTSLTTKMPYIFHMSWTLSMDNKVLYLEQMGEWYVSDMVTSTTSDGMQSCVGLNCCLQQPNITCHFRDKPSKIPCRDSPAIDEGGRSFW